MILFHPEQDIDSALFGAEISTFWIGKKCVHLLLQFPGPLKPADIKISFVEVQKTLDQERIIFGKTIGGTGRPAVTSQQSALIQRGLHKGAGALGGNQITLVSHRLESLGET